jgi:hypothetical protein
MPMLQVREEYASVAVGARVIVLWHGREKEGDVFYRTRGTGMLHVRLLDNNSTPQIPPERYVSTLVPDEPRTDGLPDEVLEALMSGG